MATSGQFCWPPVGSFVAAYGQFSMAANTRKWRQRKARALLRGIDAWSVLMNETLVQPHAAHLESGPEYVISASSFVWTDLVTVAAGRPHP
ncbi:MAG: hypothetical protein ABIO33_08075, partial [Leifsonia sp.]